MAQPGQRPAATSDPAGASARKPDPPVARLASVRRRYVLVLNLPPVRRARAAIGVYNDAGGSLLAEGLAYSALFAGLTGLLFCVGLLGYLVPAETDRRRIVDGLTGQLAPLAPVALNGLNSVAANAGAFSIVGLAVLAWGASHFYGALDQALARIFAMAPARGPLDRILRGFVSVLLLFGGLLSGIAISAIQRLVVSEINVGPQGDAGRALSTVAFPLLTAVVVVIVVGVVYRVVPNTNVPISVLRLPALVVGLVLTGLTELLVYVTPLLTGALSVFGGVAAVFATLAWLHLAFQVLLIGAAWTRLRLDDVGERAASPPIAGTTARP
jgi:YihY family inner membrane protein